jgi:hypothetical protein
MSRQVNQDVEHLRILSIFYYVFAGFWVIPFLYGIFYTVIGLVFGGIFMSIDAPVKPGEPKPEVVGGLIGGMFALIGLGISALSAAVAFVLYKTGRNLAGHNAYTFCVVIAVITCFMFPFGTALGVFSLVVLTRDSVKGLFQGADAGGYGFTPPNWR